MVAQFKKVGEIKDEMWGWVEKNQADKLVKIRKEKSAKAAATRKANADKRADGEKRTAERAPLREEVLKKRQMHGFRLSFSREETYDSYEWRAHEDGFKYILQQWDAYNPSEGEVPVEEVYFLTTDTIIVRRVV